MRSLKRPGACARARRRPRSRPRGLRLRGAYMATEKFGDFNSSVHCENRSLRLYHLCYLSVREGPGLDPLDGFREPWAPDSILC